MISWFRHLDDAKSVAQVLTVTRDFFASWAPGDIALLPEGCRPPRVRDEKDIEDYHVQLVEEFRDSRASGSRLEALQRMTAFMARASVRLAELRGDDEDEPPPSSPARSAAARRLDG